MASTAEQARAEMLAARERGAELAATGRSEFRFTPNGDDNMRIAALVARKLKEAGFEYSFDPDSRTGEIVVSGPARGPVASDNYGLDANGQPLVDYYYYNTPTARAGIIVQNLSTLVATVRGQRGSSFDLGAKADSMLREAGLVMPSQAE